MSDTAAPPAPTPESEPAPEQDRSSPTATLPKDFLGQDVVPGDQCLVEVVRVHDAEVEVKYVESEEGEEESEAPEEGPPPPPPPGDANYE